MARLARVVVPRLPHHVIQRGVRSMPIFTTEGDRREYLRLLGGVLRHVRTGRPWGTERWVKALEQRVGRALLPRKGGWPKGKPRKV